jgi:probable 2-oxoglutarate dehydrogenase E1 component DHKTD1
MRGFPTLPPSLPPSQFTDDVLSHLFLSSPFTSSSSSSSDPMTIHLLPNPSHLETVTPIGQGFARGLQIPFSTSGSPTSDLGEKVLNVAIHGDGAFIGQGIVGETLNLSGLPHFNVGGTIRIVVRPFLRLTFARTDDGPQVNNQLGYTTSSLDARTSFYATDLAKSISAPIVHVNGDRIDDVARAVELAMAYQEYVLSRTEGEVTDAEE